MGRASPCRCICEHCARNRARSGVRPSYSQASGRRAVFSRLPEPQTKALEILLQLTSLLISLALGVIGGLAFFLKERRPNVKWTTYQIVLIFVCGLTSMLSMFFGHAIFSVAVEMLANDILDLLAPSIIWSVRLQYICLLLAVTALLFFAFEVSVHSNISPSDDRGKNSL